MLQEYCAECEDTGRLKTVARSTELRDNAILPPTLQARAGDMIYASLRSGFRVRPVFAFWQSACAREPSACPDCPCWHLVGRWLS